MQPSSSLASSLLARPCIRLLPSHSTPSFASVPTTLNHATNRLVHDYVKGVSPSGSTIRYPLRHGSKLIGTYQSRGQRTNQEDTFAHCSISLPPSELQRSLRAAQLAPAGSPASFKPKSRSLSSDPASAFAFFSQRSESEESARGWEPSQSTTPGEVAMFGIFDGHGGGSVSSWLKDNLPSTVEDVKVEEIDSVVQATKDIGGYFKRFQGGILSSIEDSSLSIAERLTLSFLKADQTILRDIPQAEVCGSTGSIALLHSLDTPTTTPFFEARKLSVTVAHCGDTRILLCPTSTGIAQALTESHHAETVVESARLRRMSAVTGGSVVDAFGESRWLGSVENTRAFGDGRWKGLGVTAEPQIGSRVIAGQEYAFMIFVSDGVCSTIDDQEIVDLCKKAPTPNTAARAIVNYAEDINAQDNCSAMVVPLAGWGKVKGPDRTKERREFRRLHEASSGGRARRD